MQNPVSVPYRLCIEMGWMQAAPSTSTADTFGVVLSMCTRHLAKKTGTRGSSVPHARPTSGPRTPVLELDRVMCPAACRTTVGQSIAALCYLWPRREEHCSNLMHTWSAACESLSSGRDSLGLRCASGAVELERQNNPGLQ